MDELLQVLRESLGLDDELEADTPLLSSGLVDSFAVIGLLAGSSMKPSLRAW